jgi:hypothetical protein
MVRRWGACDDGSADSIVPIACAPMANGDAGGGADRDNPKGAAGAF